MICWIWGCEGPKSTPRPLPTPIAPMPMPSVSPFSLPETTAIDPLDPLVKHKGGNWRCSALTDLPIPKLKYPVDIAVNQDGTNVYVINRRCDIAGSGFNNLNEIFPGAFEDCQPSEKDTFEYTDKKQELKTKARSFIYHINSDRKIEILKVDQLASLSCELSEDIETDKNNDIYFNSMPNRTINKIENKHVEQVAEIFIIVLRNYSMSDGFVSAPPLASLSSFSTHFYALGETPFGLHISFQTSTLYFLSAFSSINETSGIYKLNDENERQLLFHVTIDYKGNIRSIATDSREGSSFSDSRASLFFSDSHDLYRLTREGFFYKLNTTPFQEIGKIKINSRDEIIIPDAKAHKIYKMTIGGTVTELAGNGQAGLVDGKGAQAQFRYPFAIDIDAEDNIYVADTGNQAIRKITPDGTVTTFYAEKP